MAIRAQSRSYTTLFQLCFLWLFLITFYLTSFEIDAILIESSKGKYRKIQKNVSNSKALNTKNVFLKVWRSEYKQYLKASLLMLIPLLFFSNLFSLFFFMVLLTIISMMVGLYVERVLEVRALMND